MLAKCFSLEWSVHEPHVSISWVVMFSRVESLFWTFSCSSLALLPPTRLQEELEVEKKLKSRLPSLTAYLQKNIPIWEKTHKSDFMYRGERYENRNRRTPLILAVMSSAVES